MQQHKYVTYLQPPEEQYIRLVQSTTQPATNNINEPFYYRVKPISKQIPTKVKPTVTVLQTTFTDSPLQGQKSNEEILNGNIYGGFK